MKFPLIWKQSILSVGQIANKGHTIVFTLTKCKVIEEETRKVIARGFRNVDKLYVLKKNSDRNKSYSSSSSNLE